MTRCPIEEWLHKLGTPLKNEYYPAMKLMFPYNI